MNIVIDTNVFVGACKGVGTSAETIAACLRGEFQPLMGTALLAEYEDVLARNSLFGSSRLSAAERSELLDIFLASSQWIRIYYCWRPNLPDEADNHLVELAVAGGGEHIVTHNIRDLGRGELLFPQLKVCTPAQFLRKQKEVKG